MRPDHDRSADRGPTPEEEPPARGLRGAVLAVVAGLALGAGVAAVALLVTPRHPAAAPATSPTHARGSPTPTAAPSAVTPVAATIGPLRVQALALTCTPSARGASSTVPDGQVCRVRLSILNTGSQPQGWSLAPQRLRGGGGALYPPDAALTAAMRQPTYVALAPDMLVEFDFYATVPDGPPPVALIVADDDGDRPATLPLPP